MPFRGDRLRLVREAKHLTQRELAQLCGFSEYQVSNFERGIHEPALPTFEKIAQQLEVSTDYLLGFSHEPNGIFALEHLTEDEQVLVDEFREKGGKGVARLSFDRMDE
jgi:transcriptional regulator with XRE-family HTH domain